MLNKIQIKRLMLTIGVLIGIFSILMAVIHPCTLFPTLISLVYYEAMGFFIYQKFLC